MTRSRRTWRLWVPTSMNAIAASDDSTEAAIFGVQFDMRQEIGISLIPVPGHDAHHLLRLASIRFQLLRVFVQRFHPFEVQAHGFKTERLPALIDRCLVFEASSSAPAARNKVRTTAPCSSPNARPPSPMASSRSAKPALRVAVIEEGCMLGEAPCGFDQQRGQVQTHGMGSQGVASPWSVRILLLSRCRS